MVMVEVEKVQWVNGDLYYYRRYSVLRGSYLVKLQLQSVKSLATLDLRSKEETGG